MAEQGRSGGPLRPAGAQRPASDVGQAVAKVLHSFGREDQLDRDALVRLVGSLSRYLGVEQVAPAQAVGAGEELTFLASKTLGGCWTLDGLWHRRGLDELVRGALAGRRCDPTAVERVLFALVANRALDPGSKLACTCWVGEVAHVLGLTGMDEPPTALNSAASFATYATTSNACGGVAAVTQPHRHVANNLDLLVDKTRLVQETCLRINAILLLRWVLRILPFRQLPQKRLM